MLPRIFRKIQAIEDCQRSRIGIVLDLLVLFFSYKTFPDHYVTCRLWEVKRQNWKFYYGSNWHPHQQASLRKEIQPSHYRIIFNDKYLCELVCRAMGFRTLHTYGLIDPRQDYRGQIESWLTASSAKSIIIKPLFGEMGRGIVVARKTENGTIVRSAGARTPLQDYVLKERAIVQKVLLQDSRMAALSPSSVNTFRVLTLLTRRGEVIIMSASIRTGTGDAFIDNWSAGGVAVGINCEKGRLKKYAYDVRSNKYASHPTTGIVFEDYPVPAWDRVHEFAISIQTAFSFYRLLGLDIAIDHAGEPVIVEINGSPDFTASEQWTGPLLKNKAVLRAFGDDGLLFNRHQKRLYSYGDTG